MGEEIASESFRPEDDARFRERLRAGVAALGTVLARPGFGAGPPTLGVELEVSLVDAAGEPAPVNDRVLAACGGEGVALELDRFNLECDSRPVALAGRPFTALREDLEGSLQRIRAAAAELGARPVPAGILPTLRTEHLGPEALSDSARFRALAAALRRLRGGPYRVEIDGPEPLALEWDDLTLEGAATAFHLHLRVPPTRFAAVYNAAQVAIAPVLAASGNSPLLLGHRLWEETRVPLFHQSVDDRAEAGEGWRPARAAFGHGWCQTGATELFAQAVALHVPVLPVVSDEADPLARARNGEVPRLDELRLHNGTVWHWTRPVYAPGDGGHLRLELRALPSGPTLVDALAGAALLVGLTLALAAREPGLTASLPFDLARRNFYAAARQGLRAVLLWPSREAPSPRPARAPALVTRLLPLAHEGLVGAGVDEAEAAALLAVVGARVEAGVTGATWQRDALACHEPSLGRRDALAAMLEEYLAHAERGHPVHEWPGFSA